MTCLVSNRCTTSVCPSIRPIVYMVYIWWWPPGGPLAIYLVAVDRGPCPLRRRWLKRCQMRIVRRGRNGCRDWGRVFSLIITLSPKCRYMPQSLRFDRYFSMNRCQGQVPLVSRIPIQSLTRSTYSTCRLESKGDKDTRSLWVGQQSIFYPL